jgi:CBS domain-containing protein
MSPELRLGDLILNRPVVVLETNSLRQVARLMSVEDTGRFPVVSDSAPKKIVGVISRSDILAVHRQQHDEDQLVSSGIQ